PGVGLDADDRRLRKALEQPARRKADVRTEVHDRPRRGRRSRGGLVAPRDEKLAQDRDVGRVAPEPHPVAEASSADVDHDRARADEPPELALAEADAQHAAEVEKARRLAAIDRDLPRVSVEPPEEGGRRRAGTGADAGVLTTAGQRI